MSMVAPFNKLKQCRYGPMLYNVNDAYVGRSLELYGEFSEGEAELFRQVLRPGDVVVEVGANIGTHTVMMAQAVGLQGVVHAFEPQRIVYQTLCANLALNNVVNTFAQLAACGEAAGTIVVPCLNPTLPNNFGGLEISGHAQGEVVPVVTVDSLGLQRCRLLKVDVEGMELTVLKGAREMIARCRPVLYVENDRQEKSAELLRYMEWLGYALFWHRPPLFNPGNFAGNGQNVFGNIVSINVMGVPSEAGANVTGFERVEVPRG